MKKKIITLIVVISGLALLLCLYGLALPRQLIFYKEEVINHPVEAVFATVTDFKNQAKWRSDLKEIRAVSADVWTEIPKAGEPMTFAIVQKIQDKRFVIRIIKPENYSGSWTGIFEKLPQNRTLFKAREVIELKNPFIRAIGHTFINLETTMDTYFNDLNIKLEKDGNKKLD
ncbi:hypothetical protein CHU92_10410 [Flavobacterium cyanobacteriorum]|uniref:Polyketide cyclase n=1 Tax=Flavobacterium cyanobacteriorum TaxID=2022802 RepID=A0A255Z2V3_9FLAO|nr:SRPBCC family protein [Flavobacterium cyanobacteriorum]OYQ35761.1 hypothetical protein CHU92_10410 [Flavobacterium cyanobacteriorum]